jgi:hypothetical protein
MPKRSSKPTEDENQTAARVVAAATEPTEPQKKNPHAVALGRKGGQKGGKARAAKLSKKRRSAIAKKAARARWRRKKPG